MILRMPKPSASTECKAFNTQYQERLAKPEAALASSTNGKPRLGHSEGLATCSEPVCRSGTLP